MNKHAKCPQCGGMADKMWQGSESDMFACPHCDNSFSKKRANKTCSGRGYAPAQQPPKSIIVIGAGGFMANPPRR